MSSEDDCAYLFEPRSSSVVRFQTSSSTRRSATSPTGLSIERVRRNSSRNTSIHFSARTSSTRSRISTMKPISSRRSRKTMTVSSKALVALNDGLVFACRSLPAYQCAQAAQFQVENLARRRRMEHDVTRIFHDGSRRGETA